MLQSVARRPREHPCTARPAIDSVLRRPEARRMPGAAPQRSKQTTTSSAPRFGRRPGQPIPQEASREHPPEAPGGGLDLPNSIARAARWNRPVPGHTQANNHRASSGSVRLWGVEVNAYPVRDDGQFQRHGRRTSRNPTVDLNRRVIGTRRPMNPVVEPIPITEQVEPCAAADVDQLNGIVGRRPRECWSEEGAAPNLVGLHRTGVENFQKGRSILQAEVAEQGRHTRRRSACIDIGQRVIDSTQQEVMGARQQHWRHVCVGASRILQRQQIAVVGN